jgi:hypothetical protein
MKAYTIDEADERRRKKNLWLAVGLFIATVVCDFMILQRQYKQIE